MSSPVFISHATKDDEFVKELRLALEAQSIPVWVDSRNLRGGNKLAPEIAAAIEAAPHFIAVLSPNTINSPWVRNEIRQALEVEKNKPGYRVIPILLPGIEPTALENWFDEEPVGIKIELKTGALSEALPALLAALGKRAPEDPVKPEQPPAKPVEELLLSFKDPKVEEVGGRPQLTATAELIFEPSTYPATDRVISERFIFTAPIGLIEKDDLHWYLEKFYLWPTGIFRERATRIEAQLPTWGQALYKEIAKEELAQNAIQAWKNAADGHERRFSVMMDKKLHKGASAEAQAQANEAASELLALPWELLHDGRSYLFHGKNPVRVRRRLPNRNPQSLRPSQTPIRILLVSPRPEQEGVSYIDHRVSAKPLVDAVEALGELATLHVLSPPTFQAMQEELTRAAKASTPYDVVHFDGHGIYDKRQGLGGLCFEDANDADKLTERAAQLVFADAIAAVMRDHRIPLVFLEACQSAQAERVESSVAASLLNEGVTSVVAMTHSVLVETARRFVAAFYHELARGSRVGTAMLAGQLKLQTDTYRGSMPGAGAFHLQDWFVPVLYQEAQDPRLIPQVPSDRALALEKNKRRLAAGALPEEPPHSFIGRSRELLALERLLARSVREDLNYVVVRGQGGEGKTTLAVELARWLLRTGRFRRAAFVSLEEYSDARGVLDSLGRQLLPEGENWSVAMYRDLDEARQHVELALRDYPTIIVVDNCESLFSSTKSHEETRREEETHAEMEAPLRASSCDFVDEIFSLCRELLRADKATRLVFTTRESLPAPFQHAHREIGLGRLDRRDAIELVREVMKQEGLEPKDDDAGNTPEEITDLVEAVNRHARALTLLAREIARQGVRATTGNLQGIMAELHAKFPDDREQSLYASVELSLRRLPNGMRERIAPLGVVHGGVHLFVLAMTLEVDEETTVNIARALIDVGLAQMMDYGHLRLDPALPAYLRSRQEPAAIEAARARWAESMAGLTGFLHEQQFKDTQIAATLTLLELPNLLAMLEGMLHGESPERVVDLADSVERLLANLGRPQALSRAVAVREAAAREVATAGGWSHARYLSEAANIDRLLERGDLPAAYAAAQGLLERCLAAGPAAFALAAYDIATARFNLGRVLRKGGAAEAALAELAEARRGFATLATQGNANAERMAAVALTESGDCLTDLGRLDEAAAAYEEAIKVDEKFGDQRSLAVDKGQLGSVRLRQQQYKEALEAYYEAKAIFESLGEPRSVAVLWHQIAMVHRMAGRFEPAEQAYRQSLAIEVREKDAAGEADTLLELGLLYKTMGRLEEAVTVERQASDLYVRLRDQAMEGRVRSNLANTLIKLQRLDEARAELRRAIECKEPYGHATEPWKTWSILHNLEEAAGNPEAAAAARQRAIESFLAYRRAGGENHEGGGQFAAMVRQAIAQGKTAEAETTLAELSSKADLPPWARVFIPKLHAILRGDRDPALADDPALTYDLVVELRMLLEG